MNETEAKGAVELLTAAFPRSVLSEETKRFYTRAFRRCETAAINEVVDALSDAYDMLPTPKAVREQIERLGATESGVDLRHAVRKDVSEYVAFRERVGDPLTFVTALEAHRRQCIDNAFGDPSGVWEDRRRACDALLAEEGVIANRPSRP